MGWNTWESIGKPLPKRLNIVLSRSKSLESQPNLLLLRNKLEVLALADYLKCDVFLIGGAQTYKEFSDVIDKWIVTEIPESGAGADAFMPEDFLENFELKETVELETDLRVKIFEREAKQV
jgi:dihydrofolate reductase